MNHAYEPCKTGMICQTMNMEKETTKYPIDLRCKDCSLFQTVEEMKKEIYELRTKILRSGKELEQYRKPPKDSSNSSIPPSQNRQQKKYPRRENSNLKVDGQKGHKGVNKAYTDNVSESINLDLDICPHCGGTHFVENKKKVSKKKTSNRTVNKTPRNGIYSTSFDM